MAVRQINQRGLDLIKEFEGLRLEACRCPGAWWIIGYGHTANVRPGDVITEKQAEDVLRTDLEPCAFDVEELVKVPLTDDQFAALVSFTFNRGYGALKYSSLLRRLNACDYGAVPRELQRWSNHKTRVGLVHRRQAEAALWLSAKP